MLKLCKQSTMQHQTWLASVRLADIIRQIDGHQIEAIHYFQVARDHLQFIDADAGFINLQVPSFH